MIISNIWRTDLPYWALKLFKIFRAFFFIFASSVVPAVLSNLAWRLFTQNSSEVFFNGSLVSIIFGGKFWFFLVFWFFVVAIVFGRILHVTGYSI